jgi:hypothetical protein
MPNHIPNFQHIIVKSKHETYILSINAPGYISVQSLQFQPCPISGQRRTHIHPRIHRDKLVPIHPPPPKKKGFFSSCPWRLRFS